MQREFFKIFKKSQLLMPVIYGDNVVESIKNSKPGETAQIKGGLGFDINYLTDKNGEKAVPLFTSSQIMQSAGITSSAIAIFMSDLADMLRQTHGKYRDISLNPFTDYSLEFPVTAFISLFEDVSDFEETLTGVLKLLYEHSSELEEDIVLFLRSDENFMVEDAVDEVFIPQIPFNASIREDFNENMKYLNILLMDKGKRILHLGNAFGEDHYDTVIAPGSEFHLIEKVDEVTSVWKCENQPFYE